MPNQLTAAFPHEQELDWLPWDGSHDSDVKNLSTSGKGPTFRLLIPTASKATLSLCRIILSAAILNYPPPTLLGFGNKEDVDGPGADVMRDALRFVGWKDAREDDLVLIVDESLWLHRILISNGYIPNSFLDALFQLPAEVLISRFFHTIRDSNYVLLQKYGRYPGNSTASQRPQRYYTNVLFGAQKDCTDSPSSPACPSAPPSTLPEYPHDPYKRHEWEHRRPRYFTSSMVMGTVGHLRPIYKYASDLLNTDVGRNGSQDVLAQIFGAQEHQRALYHQSTLSPFAKASKWIASRFIPESEDQCRLLYHSTILNKSNASDGNVHRDFGISLDYTSSVLQVLDCASENDVQFVKSSNLSKSLHLSERSLKKIHLPRDLNGTAPPYGMHPPSEGPLTALEAPPQSLAWSDINLATNFVIPESPIIPSILHISPQINATIQLWYEPYARTLFQQSLHAPPTSITLTIPPLLQFKPNRHMLTELESAALNATQQSSGWREVSYTDLRGGRGGIWTEKGEWKAWDEVCGAFDDVLLSDGKVVLSNEGAV